MTNDNTKNVCLEFNYIYWMYTLKNIVEVHLIYNATFLPRNPQSWEVHDKRQKKCDDPNT